MQYISLLLSLVLKWWLLSAVSATQIDPSNLVKRMTPSTSGTIENKLQDQYKLAGFQTTPYEVMHLYAGPTLQRLESSAKASRYARFIHHAEVPVFSIKEVDLNTIRQGLKDHDKIFYHYQTLTDGRTNIWQQEPGLGRKPYPEDLRQISDKIAQKTALTATGIPRDVVDLVHGKPFPARSGRAWSWSDLRKSPSWSSVKKNAREFIVHHEAGSSAPHTVFDHLRATLAEERMVKTTNTLNNVRIALRLDKLGNVEYKVLSAAH